ncbi:polysaccharide deacetylase family protein [Aestuariivivens sediminicola]|uniref:polysaccharide deacetylase family protein n=1 Tax=Aestuariivivens sediminicola TaxID=2913560 RepID=UPI001F5A51DF|nr:polysaccharide deacetylase family protein [Aestuariivivens sediminicola]
MGITPVKTPVVIKKMFPNYIWDMPVKSKSLYLTFDDGPTPDITDWILQTLDKFNAKATFFCIGNNVSNHPELFKHMVTSNHSFGNHTHNHMKGWKTKTKDYIDNIHLCETTFKSCLPKPESPDVQNVSLQKQRTETTSLFRPPYGKMKSKQSKHILNMGYKIVMWDVLSFDWDQQTPKEVCLNHVITKSTEGSIIVFHDSIKASKNMTYALPRVLEHFSEKGFRFEAI